ncbi:UvrD-helicase domain-containing protein [Pseudomonas putida]|uniref:UvrD-helicase domain-containing protein n=1 Tax=Pseudomonas putida TaxID=303 RepID=UPI0018C980C4|nr:UvrD-helicase domain-containing protein [Pseudomonas putida]MCE0962204.1 AAA family ATPase [Pseudomonas putida]QPN45432.1 AAA family ATPase [Priestia aryabhattai]
MTDELATKLNDCNTRGYVIAPAGYGKTYLIALAVRAASGRQLVLTHTFAGVNSIKTKMTALRVPSSMYQVDTIASWSLRLCLAYPKTSGWVTDSPADEQWNQLYASCAGLLGKSFIRRTVSSSYAGVYVDEYQDCSDLQHSLVCTLADFMPCRVLGDPMQSIFDFDNAKPVDWEASVYPTFECLGELDIPWRWARNPQLGAWLKDVRNKIEAGQKIDLLANRPPCVIRHRIDPENLEKKQYSSLYGLLNHNESVIALHGGDQQSKNKTHLLARSMAGRFSSIEEIEGKGLHTFLKQVNGARTTQKRFLLALEFAKKCFTGVSNVLTAGTKRGEVAGLRKGTKYPALLLAANAYLADPTSLHLMRFFLELKANPETGAYRRDLLNRLLQILKLHGENAEMTIVEAGKIYQRDMRHMGRPTRHKKLIGTTLLVKGLEFDHAVILDADSLDAKDLYVAMTRGTKSLTIIGSGRHVPVR